ncbi:ferrochelatase hem15 [Elasticomyces elasticus]|nr:ferrochelatase hem15 [Elasticomyces elasticus]
MTTTTKDTNAATANTNPVKASAAEIKPPTLMSIAPELRNNIFKLVIKDTVETVTIERNGCIRPNCVLVAVSRQIRKEARPVFLHAVAKVPIMAKRIIAWIDDFDFKPLRLFIDSLDQKERKAIVKKQNLYIVMGMGRKARDPEKVMPGVALWLAYCAAKLDGDMTSKTGAYRFVTAVPQWGHATGKQIMADARVVVKKGSRPVGEVDRVVNAEWKKISRAWYEKYCRLRKAEISKMPKAKQEGANRTFFMQLVSSGLMDFGDMATEDDLPTASPLMSLAPELRNMICEQVILEELEVARIGARGHLVDKPDLLAVCRQLRQEALPVYLELAPTHAEELIVNVREFDFTPLITYLDCISAEQWKIVADAGNLWIDMTVSDEFKKNDVSGIRRWTRYCSTRLASTVITQSDRIESAYNFAGDGMAQTSSFMRTLEKNASNTCLTAELREAESREWESIIEAWEARPWTAARARAERREELVVERTALEKRLLVERAKVGGLERAIEEQDETIWALDHEV